MLNRFPFNPGLQTMFMSWFQSLLTEGTPIALTTDKISARLTLEHGQYCWGKDKRIHTRKDTTLKNGSSVQAANQPEHVNTGRSNENSLKAGSHLNRMACVFLDLRTSSTPEGETTFVQEADPLWATSDRWVGSAHLPITWVDPIPAKSNGVWKRCVQH